MTAGRRTARIRAVLAALVVACGGAGGAAAMEFEVRTTDRGDRVAVAQGPVTAGDGERFRAFLDRAGVIDEVWLNSGGGLVSQGYAMGREIRTRGLATRVPRGFTCASSCVSIFLGGVVRTADADGALGLHMFTVARNEEVRTAASDRIRRDGERGAGAVIMQTEQRSAITTAEWNRYVLQMGASVRLVELATAASPDEMRWLTRAEMRSVNLVNAVD